MIHLCLSQIINLQVMKQQLQGLHIRSTLEILLVDQAIPLLKDIPLLKAIHQLRATHQLKLTHQLLAIQATQLLKAIHPDQVILLQKKLKLQLPLIRLRNFITATTMEIIIETHIYTDVTSKQAYGVTLYIAILRIFLYPSHS